MSQIDFYVDGVVLSNYRAFGNPPQFIAPFSKLNLFVGANNSGKSAVLRFLSKHLGSLVCSEISAKVRNNVSDILYEDIHIGATRPDVVMGYGTAKQVVLSRMGGQMDVHSKSLLEKVVNVLAQDGFLWVHRKSVGARLEILDIDERYQSIKDALSLQDWQRLWIRLTGKGNGGIDAHWIPDTLTRVAQACFREAPKVRFVPAIREISDQGDVFDDFSGKGLIEELARHQNPSFSERELHKKFEKINQFLRSVVRSGDARIEIPHNLESILVHMDGRVLPLGSLGTGVHEVIMLAAFCTFSDEEVVCIEEPEIHLHPILQRRLIEYIVSSTNNQYFIATHSASLIDNTSASIFHIFQDSGVAYAKSTLFGEGRLSVINSLGYKASDIVQANSIVWVEGPSDRIYLSAWIKSLAPDLIEGLHFSIMFYGGRLLSHLSVEQESEGRDDFNGLIEVRKLNQNIVFIIDSDKVNADDSISGTKIRIKNEIEEGGGLCWITSGREVENYVASDQMTEALKAVYPKAFEKRYKTGVFDHVLPFREFSTGKVRKIVDKVAVAKAYSMQVPNVDVLDLKERVGELVDFIRTANGLDDSG